MWLFQNSQDQEGLRQFHDNIFSPVSSKQCSYTFIWGRGRWWWESKVISYTPCPILSSFTESHKNKSWPFFHTNKYTFKLLSQNRKLLTQWYFSLMICTLEVFRDNPKKASAILLLNERVWNSFHSILWTNKNHRSPSADHKSQLTCVFC